MAITVFPLPRRMTFLITRRQSLDTRSASETDKLTDTVNYTQVYMAVEEILSREHFSLLETIAERLASAVLERFKIKEVVVRVRKMIPPIPGNLDYIEVEIRRP